jgi:FkbM family methyltransferase
MTDHSITTPLWRGTASKRLIGALAYPVFYFLNRPAFYGLTKAIYDFALRCNGIAINFNGSYGLSKGEELFLARISKRLQGGVLVDIGAHHGHYSNLLARIAPGATIYAFEPHPVTLVQLRRAVDPERVHVIDKAVSDKPGSIRLYDFAGHDGSTQASLSQEAVAFFDQGVVHHDIVCTTVDEFVAAEKIDRIDFLKIDTEGFDLAVLKGGERALRERRISLIQFEFIPANIVTGSTMRAFFQILEGYDIFRICLNGDLLPLKPYDVKRCEIYVTQNLVAKLRA